MQSIWRNLAAGPNELRLVRAAPPAPARVRSRTAAGALALLLAAAPAAARPGERIERELQAMGTRLAIRVEAPSRAEALAASEAALRAVQAVEARLSTWRPGSELARLNRAPVGAPFPLGPELAADLARARRWYEATGGAFDPGVGALVDAWDLRGAGRVPTDAELERALAATGLRHLELAERSAVRTHAGLRLEEGGFGKGAGLDAALAGLRERGATAALVDLGGQIARFGPGTESFEIADPRGRERALLRIEVGDGSLATSGNSERGLVVDGRRIGHLLDPRTGRPAPDFGSLTVWTECAADADCLSTALFVLGPRDGVAWAAARDGVEAVSMELSGDGLVVRATSGLRGRLTAVPADLEIHFVDRDEES